MGTTAEKGQRVLQSIAEVQQGINNLGGSLTDQTPFKNFRAELDEIYNNLPKTDYEEGSNITLSNTLKGKLDFEDGIVGYGDTKQEGTPTPDNPQDIEVVRGKNRFNVNNATQISNGTVQTIINPNKIDFITGTGVWSNYAYIFKNPEKNTNFTIKAKFKSALARTTGISVYGSNTNDVSNLTNIKTDTSNLTANTEKEYSVTFNSGNYNYICIRFWNNYSATALSGDITLNIYEIQLEKGSATSYLPYNTIEVVERGKNELKPTLTAEGTNIRAANCSVTISEDEFTFVATGTDMRFGDVASSNITYTGMYGYLIEIPESATNVYLMLTNNQFDKNFVCFYDENKVSLGFESITTSKTITSGAKYCNFRIGKGGSVADTTYTTKIMVAFSSIDTYEPYQTPQTYQLSLGEYEFAKIGNYVDTIEYDVDEDKVYKNEKIGKVVLNGSETGWTFTSGSIWKYRINISNAMFTISDTSKPLILSNYYTSGLWNSSTNYQMSSLLALPSTLAVRNDDITSLDNWKTWLSTHNTEVYYPLAETTKIEITGTLKDQIKALYYSHSFTGTTIIEINGNLPLIIKVRALKGE